MKVFQINYSTTKGNPSFLQITIIGDLQTEVEHVGEVRGVLNGEHSPYISFTPSKEWKGYVDNDVVFFDGLHWCYWHPITGELKVVGEFNDALEQLVADIKYLIKLCYIDFN